MSKDEKEYTKGYSV